MSFHHADARPRRRNDIIETLELRYYPLSKGTRARDVAIVIGWLSATGLPLGYLHSAAARCQQLRRGKTGGRTEKIRKTSNEKSDAGGRAKVRYCFFHFFLALKNLLVPTCAVQFPDVNIQPLPSPFPYQPGEALQMSQISKGLRLTQDHGSLVLTKFR